MRLTYLSSKGTVFQQTPPLSYIWPELMKVVESCTLNTNTTVNIVNTFSRLPVKSAAKFGCGRAKASIMNFWMNFWHMVSVENMGPTQLCPFSGEEWKPAKEKFQRWRP